MIIYLARDYEEEAQPRYVHAPPVLASRTTSDHTAYAYIIHLQSQYVDAAQPVGLNCNDFTTSYSIFSMFCRQCCIHARRCTHACRIVTCMGMLIVRISFLTMCACRPMRTHKLVQDSWTCWPAAPTLWKKQKTADWQARRGASRVFS